MMTVAVMRSAELDVTSVGGAGTAGVETPCRNARSHTRREHMEMPNMHQAVGFNTLELLYLTFICLLCIQLVNAAPRLYPEIMELPPLMSVLYF